MTEIEPLMINCGPHGDRVAAVVCGHMTEVVDRSVGFIENESDPNDMQAWCEECEQMFLREGSMTEAFLSFNKAKLVCVVCYSDLKLRHSRSAA